MKIERDGGILEKKLAGWRDWGPLLWTIKSKLANNQTMLYTQDMARTG